MSGLFLYFFTSEKKIIFLSVFLAFILPGVDILEDAYGSYKATGVYTPVADIIAYNLPASILIFMTTLMFGLIIAKKFSNEKIKADELRISQRNLAEAQRIAKLGSWVWTIDTGRIQWSDEIYSIFGLDPKDFQPTYERFIERVHPHDRDAVKKAVVDALAKRSFYEISHRIILSDGMVRSVHERGDMICDSFGVPVRMIGTVQDITEQKAVEAELMKLSAIIEESINVVIITDASGTIEYVNPMFERVTGYKKVEALGKNPNILASGHTSEEDYKKLWNTILGGKSWRGIFRNKRKDGSFYWGNGLITPIRDGNGIITHFLAIQEDITEKMMAQEKAEYLSRRDEVTGLSNRAHTMESLQGALALYGGGSFMLVDIDGFKAINDAYGVNVGDKYLRFVSEIIKSTVIEYCGFGYMDQGGVLGRLGEDEFLVFLPSMPADKALELAENIRQKIDISRFEETMIRSTVSIGIAVSYDHGLSTKELLGRVNAAVYRAKELGKNRCYLYRADDKGLEIIRSRLMEKERILRAIDENRFAVWYQPIMRLEDSSINHFESLVRMIDEDGSIRMPGTFIGAAESFGLISTIDRLVANKAMTAESQAVKSGKDWYFSLNLSGRDIGDEDMLKFLKERALEAGTRPGRIILEITETAAIRDINKAAKFMVELRELGFRFSLDDFGVGFTSFVYLRQLPVDYIKIDGSFIRNLPRNTHDQSVVKAIVDIARSVNIQTIAEFVEDEDTLQMIRELGVDYAQGYLIGRPLPELPS